MSTVYGWLFTPVREPIILNLVHLGTMKMLTPIFRYMALFDVASRDECP